MILVSNYLALVTPLHSIYPRMVLVVQLNMQPLSLQINIPDFYAQQKGHSLAKTGHR